MPLLSRVDQVQLVRQAAAKPELVREELVFDHPHLDPRWALDQSTGVAMLTWRATTKAPVAINAPVKAAIGNAFI